MPHVITQWESMARRRDDPEQKRTSRLSVMPSTPPPRGTLGEFRETTGRSPNGFLTPTSLHSSTFSSRPSPSSSVSTAENFCFELEDTSSSTGHKSFYQESKDNREDTLKITLLPSEFASMDVPSAAQAIGGRVESVALASKVAERYTYLECQIDDLGSQLLDLKQTLASANRAVDARQQIIDDQREIIKSLTQQARLCKQHHRGPRTPPKDAPTSRPATSASASASSADFLRSRFQISKPVPGSFQHYPTVPGGFTPAVISLEDARRQQVLRHERKPAARSGPSTPTMSGGLGTGSIRRPTTHQLQQQEMTEKKRSLFGKLLSKKDSN